MVFSRGHWGRLPAGGNGSAGDSHGIWHYGAFRVSDQAVSAASVGGSAGGLLAVGAASDDAVCIRAAYFSGKFRDERSTVYTAVSVFPVFSAADGF